LHVDLLSCPLICWWITPCHTTLLLLRRHGLRRVPVVMV
jgi:hypothetical protein